MGIYFEALLLYIILFLTGSLGAIGNIPAEAADFSIITEINAIVLYFIPSIALIMYLHFKGRIIELRSLKPHKNDLKSFLFAFPCLLITGFIIAVLPSFLGGGSISHPAVILQPSSVLEWIALSFTCLFAAYLEESFFRFYLLSKRKEMGLGEIQALIFSVALFSVCHIYEGPWGFLNSVVSGAIMAFIFLRYRSLHGIAFAHALYNIGVFVVNTII